MRVWKQLSNMITVTSGRYHSCHMLQLLIFMMLGHMGEAQIDGISVQFMIFFHLDVTILYLKG